MLKWYAQVLDAKVQHQNPALAFFTYDSEHHRFAFAIERPSYLPVAAGGARGSPSPAYF